MSSNPQLEEATQELRSPPAHIAEELARARHRRSEMAVARPEGHENDAWALAFSGGGIRSATFCLGALQGLTQVPAPTAPPSVEGVPPQLQHSLLRQFDYLSTVSGGGFIGSFFTSLFGSRRLNLQQRLDDKATAEQAYRVLAEDPPGRLHSTDQFDPAHPGKVPLAWLRENGRYMASGSGDRVYASAIAIRNWCAVHYVLGTILVSLFLVLAFAHVSVMYWWGHELNVMHLKLPNFIRAHELALLGSVEDGLTSVWWSPAWWLLIPLLLFWLLPAGVAYWMTHPPPGDDLASPPQRLSRAALFALVAGAVPLGMAWCGQRALGAQWNAVANAMAVMGFITLMGVVWHTLTYYYPSITAQRVGLTHALVNGLLCLLALVAFAAVHTVAQTLYVTHGTLFSWVSATAKSLIDSNVHEESAFGVVAGGVMAVLVWAVRQLHGALAEKQRQGWFAKIPVEYLFAAVAALLFFLVAMFWAQLVLWIQWRGEPPYGLLLLDSQAHLEVVQVLGVVLLLALALAMILGRFPGFLNLSTLQSFYSARITRAYMGASNGVRYEKKIGLRHNLSVTHPAPGDLMTLEQYYANPYAPMHLINVCVNQNIDPAEQLVQRDRKGKPLAIVPGGFTLDGVHHQMPETKDARGLSARLTVGEWIGVSGAAIATGAGRGGDAGRAMLFGLANLRLGRWWESGAFRGYQSASSRYVRQAFKTQVYLLDELFARFYGTRRPLQYLSDGGHFENMALYELLRPARGIRLIVACDCGCDPLFQFADLANLMRLARIDFGIEIEVDRGAAADPVLGQVFGTPEQFCAGDRDTRDPYAAQKCALLLNVYWNETSFRTRRTDARVVVIKPRMIPALTADVAEYHAMHEAFPQEPTADQEYDEAQWESYRKLGMEISKIVFGGGSGAARQSYREALWRMLLNRQCAQNISRCF